MSFERRDIESTDAHTVTRVGWSSSGSPCDPRRTSLLVPCRARIMLPTYRLRETDLAVGAILGGVAPVKPYT